MKTGVHRCAVSFGGVLLHCEGLYYAGFKGDQTDPPEAEMFEFTYVKHREEDIFYLLGDDNQQSLAEKCIEALKDD
jgi:hypothetical protein